MCASLRSRLEKLRSALELASAYAFLAQVERALAGSEQDLVSYLESNELWGGAGSVADSAGVGKEAVRRSIHAALIDLGEQQIREGVVNRRTRMWVEAFREWRDAGPV
jgi:hypothetical protein